MAREFTHLPVNEEIRSISGHYVVEKEARLKHRGKDVLYIVGYGMADTACCGSAGVRYALVAGEIVKWRSRKNTDGFDVTDVEPVFDKAQQDAISKEIRNTEFVHQVQFVF